ncbi:maestro heat-like repeat-containing protein family member 2B [Mauremys reevesii]|uniref:maestro heat-like repeat-containing protein family member 2B n=1 Tax=Mauremys reevesii TaxID=260615 RepID=UPI00193FFD45|nr:maestro heat-like repeat-containing protein family member 2B [Mauremys reevesii]
MQLKQAIIKALGPMMSLLLHKEEYQDQIFEHLSWLLEQYKEDTDVFHVTKSLSQLLEVSGEYKIPLLTGSFKPSAVLCITRSVLRLGRSAWKITQSWSIV